VPCSWNVGALPGASAFALGDSFVVYSWRFHQFYILILLMSLFKTSHRMHKQHQSGKFIWLKHFWAKQIVQRVGV
jgi:hypothetical protein